jgi:hypothetical protein
MTSPHSNPRSHAHVKFRPVLTLEQITYITQNLSGNDPIGKSVIKVLVPMIAKIEVGAINPAYKLSETKIIKDAEIAQRQRYESGTMSAEEEANYEATILGLGEL